MSTRCLACNRLLNFAALRIGATDHRAFSDWSSTATFWPMDSLTRLAHFNDTMM